MFRRMSKAERLKIEKGEKENIEEITIQRENEFKKGAFGVFSEKNLLELIEFFDYKEVTHLSVVSKKWKKMIDESPIWKHKCQKYFKPESIADCNDFKTRFRTLVTRNRRTIKQLLFNEEMDFGKNMEITTTFDQQKTIMKRTEFDFDLKYMFHFGEDYCTRYLHYYFYRINKRIYKSSFHHFHQFFFNDLTETHDFCRNWRKLMIFTKPLFRYMMETKKYQKAFLRILTDSIENFEAILVLFMKKQKNYNCTEEDQVFFKKEFKKLLFGSNEFYALLLKNSPNHYLKANIERLIKVIPFDKETVFSNIEKRREFKSFVFSDKYSFRSAWKTFGKRAFDFFVDHNNSNQFDHLVLNNFNHLEDISKILKPTEAEYEKFIDVVLNRPKFMQILLKKKDMVNGINLFKIYINKAICTFPKKSKSIIELVKNHKMFKKLSKKDKSYISDLEQLSSSINNK